MKIKTPTYLRIMVLTTALLCVFTMSKAWGEDPQMTIHSSKSDEFKTTASGLQYFILKEGTGNYPKATDTVTVHYRGTFLDGSEFDSSYKRGKPTSFPLRGVIPGWTEGLQLVKPGGKIKLIIPPALGYGSRAHGPVPGNSTLIFEIELISVK